jgi:hypothetical protein
MKKLSFTLLLAAALCFAACGNNPNKKAKEAEVQTTECTDSCCSEKAEDSCCGDDGACGENCEGNCEKHNAEKTE